MVVCFHKYIIIQKWAKCIHVPGVVTTAANGNPFPIPFAMVTKDRYWKKEKHMHNLIYNVYIIV